MLLLVVVIQGDLCEQHLQVAVSCKTFGPPLKYRIHHSECLQIFLIISKR